MTESQRLSRRHVLTLVAGTAGAGMIVGTSGPAHAKVPQKTVKYQDAPKGDQSCANCVQFEAPSSCKTVDGMVSSEGWCTVYAKKQA